jgi:dipeptidyl aminopeptidase/acylaminoacyl peptidase
MKAKILVVLAIVISLGIGIMIGQLLLIHTQKPTPIVQQVVDRSLDKYTIENLANTKLSAGNITIEKELKDFPEFSSNEFIMNFTPVPNNPETKKTSGLINIPKNIPSEGAPLIVMIRGFVDPTNYFVGNGTINGSYYFAKNGFITIAPDFLGYGDSDKETDNVFEARFQTYTTVLALLNAVKEKSGFIPGWDKKNIFVWGHSNGGQISLTTLEITGAEYPTVLWAPVSESFPYSILYFSNEAADKGKALRRELSKFEDVYNTDLYSLNNYLNRIKAKVQLDQGTQDAAVPVLWSDTLNESLKGQGNEIIYNKYPGADHVMNPFWNTAIEKDLQFFKDNIKN